ncbi:MAG: response regulator [Pseudohongiellaceae bacterium]
MPPSATVHVLICDDSPLARKQMARSLPPEWPVAVRFAQGGAEALDIIRAGGADVLFLDLNMPDVNGYDVLAAIHRDNLPCMVLIVSGDAQPQARKWALDRGALEFIGKPVDREQLRAILQQLGLMTPDSVGTNACQSMAELPNPEFQDVIREVVNIAMGQAGGRLGTLLDTFITLPIPLVHQTIYSDLLGLLSVQGESNLYAVSQGFSARGLSGEAILLMTRQDLERLHLPHNSIAADRTAAGDEKNRLLSVLVDVCGLLAGSCLRGISEQLDLHFNHSYPVILGEDRSLDSLIGDESAGQEVLVVEICYRLEPDIVCDLLIAFTADSIPVLEQRASLLRQETEWEERNPSP